MPALIDSRHATARERGGIYLSSRVRIGMLAMELVYGEEGRRTNIIAYRLVSKARKACS
jgi:hypothetical protein